MASYAVRGQINNYRYAKRKVNRGTFGSLLNCAVQVQKLSLSLDVTGTFNNNNMQFLYSAFPDRS